MKDIQQNSPCSTGTYPLKKHNHKDASSEAALTHTWTMILSHWSSVQSWKSSGKWFLIQHGHMNLSLVQLEPCSIVAHYYTHYTMMNSATGARLPFLRLLAWFRSWRPNWKKMPLRISSTNKPTFWAERTWRSFHYPLMQLLMCN